jgi:hypothetical protein
MPWEIAFDGRRFVFTMPTADGPTAAFKHRPPLALRSSALACCEPPYTLVSYGSGVFFSVWRIRPFQSLALTISDAGIVAVVPSGRFSRIAKRRSILLSQ